MAGDGRQNADAVLVAALATGSTRQEAAKAAGVGELADATTEACQTLRDLLGADSESVRLAAARSVLEMVSRYHESSELAERIAALEERFGHQEGRRWAD